MDNNKSGNKANNNSKGRSQRRLALAILLIFILTGAFFLLSDHPLITEWRSSLFGGNETVESVEDGAEGAEQAGLPEDSEQTNTAEDAGKETAPQETGQESGPQTPGQEVTSLDFGALPEYDGNYFAVINGNVPAFPEDVYSRAGLVRQTPGTYGEELPAVGGVWSTEGSKAGRISREKLIPYEFYGELDNLGRCTVAYGCLGDETMPVQGTSRGDISEIHPSGWARGQNWERSHLIAWALGAENANEKNLVTGTHYMNHDGMRPLEEEVEHYIWNTGNHVLYMARPLFKGDELVPRGVQMSAWSCEDQGKGISFNVYCFNVTPGAEINYMNGVVTTEEQAGQEARLYVINTRSGVFHYPSCDGAKSTYKKNRKEVTATRKELTDQGYVPCGYCEP